MVAVLALALSGCGNTITGFGKDISTVGEKVTKWQNTPSEKEEVNVSKDETKKSLNFTLELTLVWY